MLTLDTAGTISGKAGTATAITYTIMGDAVGTSDSFKTLAQGQLATSTGTLYTVPASTQSLIRQIHLANTTGADVTGIVFYVNGTAATNQISGTISIPANGTSVYANGLWQMYDANGRVLTSMSSVTISTTAPLTGGGDLSSNRTFAISAATTSAAGSLSGADKKKLDNLWYDVTNYGVVGDDSTDNSTALNTLVQTTAPLNATLFFPAGTYRVNAEIAINVDKRLRFLGQGRGRSIIKSTSTTANIFNISVAGFYGSFDELGFTASVTKTAGTGILATSNNAYLNVTDCEFQSMFNGVSYSSSAGNVGYIDGCQFTAPAANGTQVTINGTGINTAIGNTTVNCTGVAGTTGIRVSACGAFQLTGSDIIGGQNAFLIDQVGACQAIFCANTYFDQSTTGATVKITGSGGANRIKFTQCGITNGANGQNAMEISGTGSTTAIPDGIDLVGCDIYNNSFTGTTNGILITGARGVSVKNSRIAGFTNGIQVTSYSAAGVTTLDVQNNTIGPTENFAGNGTGILLNVGSFTYGGVSIKDNILVGNTTAPISDASTVAASTTKHIFNNVGLPGGTMSTATPGATVLTTAETIVLQLPIPANTLRVGSVIRFTLSDTVAASTATTIKIHVGTLGTTGDASLITIGPNTTSTSGNYSTGMTAIAVIGGSATHIGNGTIVAGTLSFASNISAATSTFNSAVANIVSVSLTNGTSTTRTVRAGVLEIISP